MFILAPLIIIASSLILIFAVVYRKRDALNKLYTINSAASTDVSSVNIGGFSLSAYLLHLFPEIVGLFGKLKIHQHKALWLSEAEKLLRKIRLMFLRIERLSDAMIKKIRRVQSNNQLRANTAITDSQSVEGDVSAVQEIAGVSQQKTSSTFLKNEEERLVLEIAKNPKDGKLYQALAELYVEMEDWSDAKEAYEAAIELNPKEEILKQKLSSVLEKLISG